MKKYQVQQGDTLAGIANREYGDPQLYPVIAAQNHIANPDLVQVGQELLVPYVTRRHHVTQDDSTATRNQITQNYYANQDTSTQLIWEIVNGVAQRPIQRGAWLLIPELADVGHHTVVENEPLAELAWRWYGDDHLAVVIALANHLEYGTEPEIGRVLVVPGLNRRAAVRGDTLRSMCEEQYGDFDLDTRVAVAAAANRIADPDHLFSNQVVYFPS